MKIVSVVGARPNFIKALPVSKAIRKNFKEVLVHTGQHYDYLMNKVFFDQLGLPEVDYHLNVGSGSHGFQTGEMLKRIEEVLIKEAPDLVLVFGDTNTTIAGALAAAKLHIKVGHIEAGLRSFDKNMPEEINRILTDHCSDFLFCPTETAVKNLQKEAIYEGVYLTGDVMVDSLNHCIKIAQTHNILDKLGLQPGSYYLATIHRAENTDEPTRLKKIVEAFKQIPGIVFPCHPRTKKALERYGLLEDLKNFVKLIDPVGYIEMLALEKNAKKIITDSGGIQKEAYILGIPCITIRNSTEWVETIQDGWNILVDVDTDRIVDSVENFEPVSKRKNLFGDGNAGEKIAEILRRKL
ncbi:MAG TPA: UDP-N-acetylglucosamine 2-epimerase (non-hydrolyzing) [Candidatus Marinimicrobia bacterium]|nr:UDP-N-acetylglucosamine 2-epimerase (non-hydrolyzing) [Candidatus Neomarinimicrobiota bacterium]